MTHKTPSNLYHLLLSYETDASNEPDARRVIGHERQLLHVAIEQVATRRGSREERAAAVDHLADVVAEAERVARMWGVL